MGVEEQIHADNAASRHPEDGIQLISEMMRQFRRGASQNQVTFWAIGQLRRLVGSSASSLFLADSNKDMLVCVHCEGGADITGVELGIEEGVAGHVFHNDMAIIVPMASQNRHHHKKIDNITGFTTHNMITAPISCGDQRFGVVQLLNKKPLSSQTEPQPFEAEDLALASAISQLIAQAMMMIKLAETLIEDKVLQQELEQAKQLQALLLVQQDNTLPICGRTSSARHVGGDFYDCLKTGNRLVFCLGDVAGKGMPAALIMGFCISAFRAFDWQENSLNQFA